MGGSYSKPPEIETKYLPDELKGIPSQEGKLFVVTGTTSGTGYVFAREIAKKGGDVVMLNRKSSRAEKALESLKEEVPGGKFEWVACDLQDFESVRNAVKEIKGKREKINVVCLNAGVMALDDYATKDGYDVQTQTNVHSHFLLTKELWPLLLRAEKEDGEARVVSHSSMMKHGPGLQEKYFGKNGGDLGGNDSGWMFSGAPWKRYQQTKLANLVFANALGDKCAEKGINVLSVSAHPGFASTHLQVSSEGMPSGWLTKVMMRWAMSGEDGTCGILHGASGLDVVQKGFYGPGGNQWDLNGPARFIEVRGDVSDEKEMKDNLWKWCEAAVGEFVV